MTTPKPHCLEVPTLTDAYFNSRAVIPYGLTIPEIKAGMESVYRILNIMNTILYENAGNRLEDILLGNSLSGIISELLVKNIADHSSMLIRNTRIGGHPDLLQIGIYETANVLRGDEGIEIKSSIQRGGWQGHNPEAGYIMVFRYIVDTQAEPIEQRAPSRFVQVLLAKLLKEDWSFSGRKGESRRTPTASITKTGMHKLRSNPIYQEPSVVVDPRRYSLDILYSGGSTQSG